MFSRALCRTLSRSICETGSVRRSFLYHSRKAMSTAGAIALSHVPEASRPALFSGLIDALQLEDRPSIDFVASAVAEGGDEETQELLSAFLCRSIEAGKPDAAVSIASKYPDIGQRLFARSKDILHQSQSREGRECLDAAVIANHLRFCKAAFSLLPTTAEQSGILSASRLRMHDVDENICQAARDLFFSAFSMKNADDIIEPLAGGLWSLIAHLVTLDNKRDHLLGYSLWLRWLVSADGRGILKHMNRMYWKYLLRGLRRGDAEIRKLCLNILRLSMGIEHSTRGIDPGARIQFERYATIFETIVLGRYINQVQECERDLDDLVPADSYVDSQWLYTLLASALDSQMQESNRKFIGTWVMRAHLRTGPELSDFLRDDFLPWATQGSLYVASLRRGENGAASCSHGDHLASYLVAVLDNVDAEMEIRRTVWSYVMSRKTFAYAKVWLLKGLVDLRRNDDDSKALSRMLEESPERINGETLSEQIMRGLPDAARDYVADRLTALCLPAASARASSRRDVLEKEAIAKCSAVKTIEDIDDLWSDLDYLEFPKDLLFHIPKALLNETFMQKAQSDTGFAANIRERVTTLQKVAETKTYLIAPLNTALRNAVLRDPQSFDVLGMRDYIIRAVDNPPESTIDLMLEEATVHLFAKYEDYFGERPSRGIAALLDLISRTTDQHQLEDLISRLLQRWKTQKVPPPTVSAWKTTPQLQALVLCLENLQPSAAQAKDLIMDLLRILSIEPLPRYRYLLEWMIVRLLQRMKLEDIVLDQLASKDHHANPKFLASLMKIGSILGCSSASDEKFATQLATLYVPLAASSKVVIRHEAQWQVPILMEHARAKGWSAITSNPALAALNDYIRSLERFSEPPAERQIGHFDPETHHTFANLVEGAWFGLDSTEAPLTSREDFVKLHLADSLSGMPASCMPLGDPVPQIISSAPASSAREKPPPSAPAPRTLTEVTALQTKGTAYLSRALSTTTTPDTRPQPNLLVVASLVDNPYNLGGLSRVSEIFGAAGLTLQNQNVVGNKDFTSVSVSSHLHFPLIQLSVAGVPEWLQQRKSEGWKVVGIEQTDRSVILGSEGSKLPEKCVLVVGSEKEGIPAAVLTECDVLVEIPQMGVTRSLNVQTAVAVVLFEYVRQHRKDQKA